MLRIWGLWSCRVYSPDKTKPLPNTEANIRSWTKLYRWSSQFQPVKPCAPFCGFFSFISGSLLKTSMSPTWQFRAALWDAGTKTQNIEMVQWHFSKCFWLWLAACASLEWSWVVQFNIPIDLGEMQVLGSYSHPSSLPFWGLFHCKNCCPQSERGCLLHNSHRL